MARKNDGRKAAAGGRKGAGAKPPAGRAGVAKATAKGAKGGKPVAAAAPAPAKVKFRGRVLENEPLGRYTTYRLGGPARYFVMPADPDDVAKALDLAQERGLPWLALGLGSNVLVKDAGYPGVVIRIGKGLDRFIGSAGTVGGGVYMNAGAHGAEFAEVLTEATVMDAKGKIKQVPRKQISFKYRSSNLGAVVVLEAKLALIEEPPAKLKDVQARLFRWRKAGTPFDQPCCGSVFKNPGGPRTAGMLIDEAGLKGFTLGGTQVSPLHANYIVNTGNATASEVIKVIEHVRKTVAKKTGVELELEVKVIG